MFELAVEANVTPAALAVNIERLPFMTDGGIGCRAVLGLLVLGSDQTIEDEFRAMIPEDGVALYCARLHNETEITPENLRRMEKDIPAAAKLLEPDVRFGAIGFGCTSGAMVIGEERVAQQVGEAQPNVAVTDPVTAVRAAFDTLGVRRIALLTPYVKEINVSLRNALQARGLNIPIMGSFNEANDNVVARIAPDSIKQAIINLSRAHECDAVFVSCTSLRVARIVEDIEAVIGKPVTSSNHALAWHMLRLAGFKDPLPGRGRLYRS